MLTPLMNKRLDEWVQHSQLGRTTGQVAFIMGIKRNTLEKSLQYARDMGDPRGHVKRAWTIVGNCKAEGCGLAMQSESSWRQGIRLPGVTTCHRGHGLCQVHYWRQRRTGTTEITPQAARRRPPPRGGTNVKAEHLLEDWEILRSQGLTWKQAAPRIGVSESAMDQALRRARKRGDTRGNLFTYHPTRGAA